MAEALVKKSTVAVAKESSYGTAPSFTSANVIRVQDIDVNDNYEQIAVEEIRNTFDELPSLRGAESVEGSIILNLRGAETAGSAPEGDVLWECAVGVKNSSTGSTVASATASTITVQTGDGANFAVGDAIRVGTTPVQVVWITAISTDTLTVSPNLNPVPSASDTVGAGVHYKLSTTELSSFFLKFWRGDIVREDYGGNKVNTLEMDISTGAVVTPKFNFRGQSMAAPTTESYSLGTPTFNSLDPLVGVSQTVNIGGSSVGADSFAFRLNNEIYERQDITTSGISKMIRTGRKIEGSFSVLYESADIFNAFKNATDNEALIVLGRNSLAAGQIVAIRIPKMRYTAVPISKDSKIFKYDITWEAVMTNGEDTLTSISFL